MLEAGADKDINARTDDGECILHKAAFGGNAETVKLLLEAGADKDINAKTNERHERRERYSVLHVAVLGFDSSIETVKLLLEAGADKDINAKTKYGKTALHFAADRGNTEVDGTQ